VLAFNILFILIAANATPLLTAKLWSKISNHPLDLGSQMPDGNPSIGCHKTFEGLISGIAGAGLVGFLVGPSAGIGLILGSASLFGDGLTSFIKRRLGIVEGEPVRLLDYTLEGGLPLVLGKSLIPLSWPLILFILLLYIGCGWIEIKISGAIFSTPSCPPDSVRTVRSPTSQRQWRSCHAPLSPLARLLNFENVIYYRWLLKGAFKILGIYGRGKQNALNVQLKPIELNFDRLPEAFNGYRILFMSDLHIDGLPGLCERLIHLVKDIQADLCLFGGDYRIKMFGSFIEANHQLEKLVRHIRTPDGIYGILGNHDCLEIAPTLEDSRICMLINESTVIERNGRKLAIVGVDDPHYYKCHDLDKAFGEVSGDEFSILLAHSPDITADLDGRKVDLCLCGHTHAGQIRLPGIGALFTHCKAPRKYAAGLWQYQGTVGYTTWGVGSSGVPVRFNCPPEVVVLTLLRSVGNTILPDR
jgi:predicted MPP superfamily phosphohydrolase